MVSEPAGRGAAWTEERGAGFATSDEGRRRLKGAPQASEQAIMVTAAERERANLVALRRMCEAEPVLAGVAAARDAVPGMTDRTILTSGPAVPFALYTGGQRAALVYAALYEGLADSPADAERRMDEGDIVIGACHDHGCVGSVAGVFTASMPVFVVRDRAHGTTGLCNFYEGESRKRLNYGSYDDGVRDQLRYIERVIAPTIGAAVERAGGIPLKPIMRRAVHMGDELHSRNTAATLLFGRELFPHLLAAAPERRDDVLQTLSYLSASDYFFLRLSMASGKAVADAARGIEASSVVTAMSLTCRGVSIRVSGLGDDWFDGPFPYVSAKLFDGFTPDDIEWIGGESLINETVGLGGFAQAAAFPLQNYQGGSPEAMIEMNLAMYDITVGENTDYKIPYLRYRGTPTAIDVLKVVETGITPVLDAGLAGRGGGQIGAGVVRAPLECFQAAASAYHARYGPVAEAS
jgi:Protein of unknown function (DUF1116)